MNRVLDSSSMWMSPVLTLPFKPQSLNSMELGDRYLVVQTTPMFVFFSCLTQLLPMNIVSCPRRWECQGSAHASAGQESRIEMGHWRAWPTAQRADEGAVVGHVYVKYVDAEGAQTGLKALAWRSFVGRSIIATILNEDSQTMPPLNLIFAPQPDAP
ncbi:hypothetical protein EDB19DRAFT_1706814, partial [Suillus lakei]